METIQVRVREEKPFGFESAEESSSTQTIQRGGNRQDQDEAGETGVKESDQREDDRTETSTSQKTGDGRREEGGI